jgi:phosphoenolpyruvate carboxykinase (GTP)
MMVFNVPGSPLSKIGIELTDSAYVAINMRIMTRVGTEVMRLLARGAPFVKCAHSVGVPLQDGETSAVWPCNPENVMIAHKPDTMEILRWEY